MNCPMTDGDDSLWYNGLASVNMLVLNMIRTYIFGYVLIGNGVATFWHDSRKSNGDRGIHAQGLVKAGEHIRQLANRLNSNLLIARESTSNFLLQFLSCLRVSQQEVRCSGEHSCGGF